MDTALGIPGEGGGQSGAQGTQAHHWVRDTRHRFADGQLTVAGRSNSVLGAHSQHVDDTWVQRVAAVAIKA